MSVKPVKMKHRGVGVSTWCSGVGIQEVSLHRDSLRRAVRVTVNLDPSIQIGSSACLGDKHQHVNKLCISSRMTQF